MKRIFACLFVTAVLPLMASPTQNGSTNSAPFATVAFAGHTSTGGWCDCGAPGCICDPGEDPRGQSAGLVADRNGRSLNQGSNSVRGHRTSGFDFGSSALMLALAFFRGLDSEPDFQLVLVNIL
jgi:hypothetical protein